MADPMYRQIAQDLQGKIESGELAPGDKLPSEVILGRDNSHARISTRVTYFYFDPVEFSADNEMNLQYGRLALRLFFEHD